MGPRTASGCSSARGRRAVACPPPRRAHPPEAGNRRPGGRPRRTSGRRDAVGLSSIQHAGVTRASGAGCAAIGQTAVVYGSHETAGDFRSAYRHGFLRVAACTLRTAIGDPPANAASVLNTARECAEDGVGLAIFPELALSGYSIEDILLQDTLLDAAERALATVVEGSTDLLPVLVFGLPIRYRHRILNVAAVVHRGRLLGLAP